MGALAGALCGWGYEVVSDKRLMVSSILRSITKSTGSQKLTPTTRDHRFGGLPPRSLRIRRVWVASIGTSANPQLPISPPAPASSFCPGHASRGRSHRRQRASHARHHPQQGLHPSSGAKGAESPPRTAEKRLRPWLRCPAERSRASSTSGSLTSLDSLGTGGPGYR